MVGCDCPVCLSDNPYNKRLRCSILIETEGLRILVDSSPDLRVQSLRHNITELDAVIYTHAHADHAHGIDDLRSFAYKGEQGLSVYAAPETMSELQTRFPYCFLPAEPGKRYRWFRPVLFSNIINYTDPFQIGNLTITPFLQQHGKVQVVGFRIGDFAYSTDVHTLPEQSLQTLAGVKLWVVDCLTPHPTPTHAHLAQSLQWIAQIKPERAILTHLSHYFDYQTLKDQLPQGIEPAYDGMVINWN